MASPAEMAEITRQFREMLLRDPYRPRYHFAIPDGDGNPGDPNCSFYADGRHHLMYLYRRQGKPFCFGHISSVDLIHWRHHPDAQGPGLFDNGCFSGGAFVDEDKTAYITYWIVSEGTHKPGTDAGIQILRSTPPYEVWERLPQVAIPSTEWGIRDDALADGSVRHLGCADPSNIWKKDGVYYLQTGNLLVLNKYGRASDSPQEFRGDWTELFASTDLQNWVHKGRFYRRRADNAWTDETEDDMCPTFLPLPASKTGGAPSGKYLQTFIAHNKGCQYYIGSLRDEFFFPENHGRMSWRDNTYFAPEAYLDGQGRQILFAWLLDNLPDDFRRYGWSGVYALPRVLWLNEHGGLGIAPIPELHALRIHPQDFGTFTLHGDRKPLGLHSPNQCEIQAKVALQDTAQAGLSFVAADGSEALLYYDGASGELVFDASKSGGAVREPIERAPFTLLEAEALQLTVYVDGCVLEIFANDRQAISRRIYWKDPGSLRVEAFSHGTTEWHVKSYEMAASNMY